MYGINYNGFRKKDTYDELIDYVMNKQEKIKYPKSIAKFLRESPQLSNLLDGNGEGLIEMEAQQKRQVQEVEKEESIREMASRTSEAGSQEFITIATRPENVKLDFASQDNSPFTDATNETIETEEEKQRRIKIKGQKLIQENIADIADKADYYMKANNNFLILWIQKKRKIFQGCYRR